MKTEISALLTSGSHSWKPFVNGDESQTPDSDRPVCLRLENRSNIWAESDDYVYYSESMVIASYDKESNSFRILPPYPRYDFSPITNRDELREGTVITHWAEPVEEEIEGWEQRFRPFRKYTTLELKVDNDHELSIYRSLSTAAAMIFEAMQIAAEDNDDDKYNKFRRTHDDLCDLMSAIDNQ